MAARVAGELDSPGEVHQLRGTSLGQIFLQLGRKTLHQRGGAAGTAPPQDRGVLSPEVDTLLRCHARSLPQSAA